MIVEEQLPDQKWDRELGGTRRERAANCELRRHKDVHPHDLYPAGTITPRDSSYTAKCASKRRTAGAAHSSALVRSAADSIVIQRQRAHVLSTRGGVPYQLRDKSTSSA